MHEHWILKIKKSNTFINFYYTYLETFAHFTKQWQSKFVYTAVFVRYLCQIWSPVIGLKWVLSSEFKTKRNIIISLSHEPGEFDFHLGVGGNCNTVSINMCQVLYCLIGQRFWRTTNRITTAYKIHWFSITFKHKHTVFFSKINK